MAQKMERFTQRARRVLNLAQEEAERLEHGQIDTEHLLLGLFLEDGGVGGRVLRDFGIEFNRIEELAKRLTLSGTRRGTESLMLSSNTKKVLELTLDEARRMGHHYLGTEHLLLGLVRMQDGVAVEILRRLDISPEEIRRQTRRFLQEPKKLSQQATPQSEETTTAQEPQTQNPSVQDEKPQTQKVSKQSIKPTTPKVFISYRRDDSQYVTDSILGQLHMSTKKG